MRCHYIYDKIGGKVHIPGCWGAVHDGPAYCTCYEKRVEDAEREEVKQLRRQIAGLEKYNASLQRIIKQLIKKK